MRFDIVTLFPDLFAPLLASGVTRRAYESGRVQVRLWDLREHGEGAVAVMRALKAALDPDDLLNPGKILP